MKEGGGFQRLLRKTKFASQLIAIIIDEVHCLKLWSSFRRDYQDLGRLRFFLPDRVRFGLVSATLPRPVLTPVMSHLGVTSNELRAIRLSNDRDNIALVVRKMKYPASSFRDLDFLVPGTTTSDTSGSSSRRQHKKFVVFFDNKKEATDAGRHLRQRLPIDQRSRIIWFMADMSPGFKEAGVSDLASGKLLGICATDSFGMVSICGSPHSVCRLTYLQGIDLKDIDLIIQWKVTCDPCMLWQRFGRGARDKDIQATALLFVEAKDLDPVDPPEGQKRKSQGKDDGSEPKSKRARKEKPTPRILDADGDGEDEFWKGRKAVYHEPINDEKKVELNQVLDDVINAEGRGIRCRRKPFKVFFDDDEPSGLCPSLSHSTLNEILQDFATVTTQLMGLVLAVHHVYLASAAISVIQKSLQICFASLTQGPEPNHVDQK